MKEIKSLRMLLTVLALTIAGGMVTACEEEGPGEKMGKQLDKTMDDMKDAIE